MTAPWHVGPIEGSGVLVAPRHLAGDPRLPLLHDHRSEDDSGEPRPGRRVYAVAVGLLATVLIAPQTTEFATKVAILGALFAVCATRGVIELVGAERLASLVPRMPRRPVCRLGRACRRSRVRGARRRGRCSGASGGGLRGGSRRRSGASGDRCGQHAGHRHDRRGDCADNRARHRRRPAHRAPGASRSKRGPRCGSSDRDVARGALERHENRGDDHGGPVRRRPDAAPTASQRRSGGAACRRAAGGNADDIRIRRQRDDAGCSDSAAALYADAHARPRGRELSHRPIRGRRASRWGERRPSRAEQATSAAPRSTTSRIPSGSTSGRERSGSGCRSTRPR